MSNIHNFTPYLIETRNFTFEISTDKSFTSQVVSGRSFTIQILGLSVITTWKIDITKKFYLALEALKQVLYERNIDIDAGKSIISITDALTQYMPVSIDARSTTISTILKDAFSLISLPIVVPARTFLVTLSQTLSETVSIAVPAVSFVVTPEFRKYNLLLDFDPDTLDSLDPETLTDLDYTLV